MTEPREVSSPHFSRRSLLAGAAAALAAPIAARAAEPETRLEPLPPGLPGEVFRERQARIRAARAREGLDAAFVTPSTNLRYLANLSIGRSERLTALLLPVHGPSLVVTPFFEKPRSEKNGVYDAIETWEEAENPVARCAAHLPRNAKIGIEGSTAFHTAELLRQAVGGETRDFTAGFDELRSVKSEAECSFIRAAGARTLRAIEATWKRLTEGMTELDAAAMLSQEFAKVGTPSGGLVQFGASAALPHGGPGERRLKKGDVVLIDTGCEVHGYTSDITRTVCFGSPSDRVRKVYETVDRAQRAGISALRAGAPGEAVDAAARGVIAEAGFGTFFTHRLGHGLGMDGHETPYLVSGNKKSLIAGNVVTVEPGIYLPGEFGVRIEDDYLVTSSGSEGLSPRPRDPQILNL